MKIIKSWKKILCKHELVRDTAFTYDFLVNHFYTGEDSFFVVWKCFKCGYETIRSVDMETEENDNSAK